MMFEKVNKVIFDVLALKSAVKLEKYSPKPQSSVQKKFSSNNKKINLKKVLYTRAKNNKKHILMFILNFFYCYCCKTNFFIITKSLCWRRVEKIFFSLHRKIFEKANCNFIYDIYKFLCH